MSSSRVEAASDPTTQSNYLKIATQHVSVDWTIDWTNEIIFGSIIHSLKAKEDGVNEVIFDTADLVVERALVEDTDVSFELKARHKVMGSALHITLPSKLRKGSTIDVKIIYKTSKDCIALQWLEKEQTQGKQHPYLFSQCQPIYARALAPLQDASAVKITYSAKVASVLPVLLSALRQDPPSDGPIHDGKVIGRDMVTYVYNQPIPIPSYLIAIASGNVRYRAFPKIPHKEWTCGIWTEPESLDAAYWEFSEDTGKFLAAEENLVTPYRFGVYDILVLPPSFPYGGMENPCLSFLTPTLLAGDRSLVGVVVHELTHSWFGNGVTHALASHFWLNEGWTTYMERLLQQELHSPAHRGFSYLLGAEALKRALENYREKPKYQRLIIDFESGEDPDDAYSSVPYEKGANFLLHIEQKLGGLDVFLPYIKDYASTFTGQSITSNQWKEHLFEYFAKHGGHDKVAALNSIDFDKWFYGEGTELPVEMKYDTSLAEEAYVLAKRWDASRSILDISKLEFKADDISMLSSNQIALFLDELKSYKPLPSAHITHLGSLYQFTQSQNTEIRSRFYQLALADPNAPVAKALAPDAANWIVGADGSGIVKGRMKFCRPVFKCVFKVDKQLAVDVFSKSKDLFHPIARKLIEKDLEMA